MIHYVSKRYSAFGDFSLLISKDVSVISNAFSQHGFALVRYNQNTQSGIVQNPQTIVISNQKERVSISFSLQRIDVEFSGSGCADRKYLDYFLEILKLYEKGFYRVAISQILAVEDEKNFIKKEFASNLLNIFNHDSLSEYEFRLNSPTHKKSEEINRIMNLNTGYIQNIKINNGIVVPVMKKSVYFSTDINTSEKNFTNRFDEHSIEDMFSSLEEYNESMIKSLEKYLNSLK